MQDNVLISDFISDGYVFECFGQRGLDVGVGDADGDVLVCEFGVVEEDVAGLLLDGLEHLFEGCVSGMERDLLAESFGAGLQKGYDHEQCR